MIRITAWLMALVALMGAATAQEIAEQAEAEDDSAVVEEAAVGQGDRAALAADLEAFIDGLMASYQATFRVPGYGLSVVDGSGTLLAKGYGLADAEAGTPVVPDGTRFHVASISKTFVWTAAMMLVDRGLLDLDKDVNVYLKSIQMPGRDRPLTMNDLMAHKGGFEDGFDIFSTKIDELSLIDAMTASQPDQIYPRGETVAYSNWGTNLAAIIVADIADVPYSEFLFTEILEPLGMTGTALGTTGEAFVAIPASKNYGVTPFGPEEQGQIEMKNFAPIGGMTITPADMGRWMRFHLGRGELDGVRLLSEETYALMRERAFDGNPLGSDIAHGFMDSPYRSIRIYGHDGSINSVFSTMVIAPDLDLAVFLTQNSHATYTPIGHVPRLVIDRVLTARGFPDTEIADDAPTGEAATEAAEELAGRYVSSRRPVRGYERLFGGIFQSKVSAKDGAVSLDPERSPYTPIAPDVWENAQGTRMQVLRFEDGTMRGLIVGGSAVMLPVTLATDIFLLAGAYGLTVVFLVTTYLGLWRRWGRGDGEATAVGRALSLLALASVIPMTLLGAAMVKVGEIMSEPYGELFADYPPAEVISLVTMGSVVMVTGAVLLFSIGPAWASSGWSIWRKLHHTALGLAYGSLGVGLVQWGVAFSSVTIG
ncbi:MAG: serine hydrolase domain-containing protein [Pseudomonadota bacterium]